MIRKIKAGAYEYTDSNGGVWRVLNHGYTRGYASVMWVGICYGCPHRSNSSIVIWGYSRKDVIERIDER